MGRRPSRTLDERRAEWSARWDEVKPAPFRVAREVVPGLFQIRTRGSRCYLVVEDEITLIDTGNPGSGERILTALKELGRTPDDIARIVITHSHIDHVGGLREIQKYAPGKTGVHLADAGHIESDEPLPNPFQHPLLAKVIQPYLSRNDPGRARVDVLLQDGDELPALGGMRIVHTPGHTAGHISMHFPNRGVLLVGDSMQYKFGRLMLPSRMFSEDMNEAGESIRKMAGLEFDTLVFSHFRPILGGANERAREFAGTLPRQAAG